MTNYDEDDANILGWNDRYQGKQRNNIFSGYDTPELSKAYHEGFEEGQRDRKMSYANREEGDF